LSACETASGNDQAALGLAGLAVRAGARSVVGTLWAISDASAADVFAAFYEKLGDASYTNAEALRHAQLELKSSPEFSHPFFWSPFLIINNWY
jgi:CHAT domain-containing protein